MEHQEQAISSYEPTRKEHESAVLEQEAEEILVVALQIIEQENTRFDLHGEQGENEHFMDKMTDLIIKAQGTKAAIIGEFFDATEDPLVIASFQKLLTKGEDTDKDTRNAIRKALTGYLTQKLSEREGAQRTDTKH